MRVLQLSLVVLVALLTSSVNASSWTVSLDSGEVAAVWQVANFERRISCPGSVPGDVFTDLLACGELQQEPYYRYNDLNYRWVGVEDWTYTAEVSVPSALLSNNITILVLEGVDTVAQVSWNHQPLGLVDNMFRKYIFAISREYVSIFFFSLSLSLISFFFFSFLLLFLVF